MVAEESVVRVPSIEGKALTGDKFAAPGDFTRPFNILLIAFLREQQEDIDTWLLRLEELEDSDQDIAVYEFPVLPEMNRVTRWFIYQGMRGGIPSERARARTVTFHLDKEEFRNALKIGTEDSIQVFLADSSGTVIWRETGVWSEAKQSEMMSVIRPQEKPGAP
jgi:hypothetical protein